MEADGRQLEEREHAAHGAARGVEAEAGLLRSMQVQAQIALHLLAQPLQQAPLRSGQQLIIIRLRITANSSRLGMDAAAQRAVQV